MYEDATAEDIHAGVDCLWVVIAVQGRSACFELDGQVRNSIGLGSSPCADLCIEHTERVPIELNLTRSKDDVWLIPGWPTNFIRIDDLVVDRPVKLWRRCCLEIEGIRCDVRIREEPPTFPDCGSLAPESSISAVELAERADEPVMRECPGHGLGDTHDAVPSSTAPLVCSVATRAGDAVRPLERLGMLTKRRPLVVTCAATAGAVVMAASMHLGAKAMGPAFARVQPARVESISPFSHLRRHCIRATPIGEPAVCDPATLWLLRSWPELGERFGRKSAASAARAHERDSSTR